MCLLAMLFLGFQFNFMDKKEEYQPIKEGRKMSILHEIISQFLLEESNRESFITVSYVQLNQSGRTVTVHVSVFPEEKEERCLEFLKRKENDCYRYVKKNTNLKFIPVVRFVLSHTRDI